MSYNSNNNNNNNQNNQKKSLIGRSISERIKLLKNLVKLLYDDISYEIINYIINLKGIRAEEQLLAERLNLNYSQVRQSLLQMGKHGILLQSEYKQPKKNEEDEKFQNYKYQKYSNKTKTSEWHIHETFYDTIKNRFESLKIKLENDLRDRENLKFICGKCQMKYDLEKAMAINKRCTNCIDQQELVEKKKE